MQLGRFWMTLAICCVVQLAAAQSHSHSYVVKFTDKHNTPFSLSRPEEFLSQKTISKRIQFNVGFDAYDLPVNPNYIEQVEQLCHCKVAYSSKWFNAVVLRLNDTLAISFIEQLPFVKEVELIGTYSSNRALTESNKTALENNATNDAYIESIYGKGTAQIEMLNGQLLHELGFNGTGIDLAVLDAGFVSTDRLPAFEKLRNEGRIKMTRDFAFGSGSEVFSWSTHGNSVLSIIAGESMGNLTGTAPKANFFLFRTENVLSETPEEEYNWAAAAELCDSIGIDIINTSLGYSVFDDSTMNYTYADMDGNTTIITRAADMAAAKGMLVINSAGNEGDDDWHYITAPADGDSVLTIGAVDSLRQHAFFSSYGPSSDGRVKPNVSTMGLATAYAGTDSSFYRGNGTSFSAPVLSGMAACLWQAFPQKSNMEIFSAIEQSAHLYHNPNDALGYGIPDFWRAFQLLQSETQSIGELQVQTFPNPCIDYLNIILTNPLAAEVSYSIYDIAGREIYKDKGFLSNNTVGVLQLNEAVRTLSAGNYTLRLELDGKQSVVKFVKINEAK